MVKKRKKFRSYYEYDGKRYTVPRWKAWVIRVFGTPIGGKCGYKFRGRIYVIR